MAIITISRGTFSGGQNIAECVATKLGYRSIGYEIFEETARLYGISERRLFEAVSGVPGIIEHLHSARKRYLACLRAVLIDESVGGNMVYYGHAGHFLLNGIPNTIKVRVIANMEFRIQTVIKRQHISRQEAVETIKKADEERIRWTRILYHTDLYDPALYDIVVNLDNLSYSGACDLLCKTADLSEYKVTEKSKKLLQDLMLSSHLKAVVANTKNIAGGENINIEADGGIVTIRGTVGSLVDADRVRMIVRKTPGVHDVISRMRVRLPCFTLAKISVC